MPRDYKVIRENIRPLRPDVEWKRVGRLRDMLIH